MTNTATLSATTRDDDYESLCERARLAGGSIDDAKWQIGDIALEVSTRYGEKNLTDFARDINRSRSSVYDYRRVSNRYDPYVRNMYADSPNISWSHFQRAAKAPTLDKSLEWLELAANETLTVDDLTARMIADTTGERLTKLATMDTMLYRAVLGLDELIGNLPCSTDVQLRIVIYEVTAPERNGSE